MDEKTLLAVMAAIIYEPNVTTVKHSVGKAYELLTETKKQAAKRAEEAMNKEYAKSGR